MCLLFTISFTSCNSHSRLPSPLFFFFCHCITVYLRVSLNAFPTPTPHLPFFLLYSFFFLSAFATSLPYSLSSLIFRAAFLTAVLTAVFTFFPLFLSHFHSSLTSSFTFLLYFLTAFLTHAPHCFHCSFPHFIFLFTHFLHLPSSLPASPASLILLSSQACLAHLCFPGAESRLSVKFNYITAWSSNVGKNGMERVAYNFHCLVIPRRENLPRKGKLGGPLTSHSQFFTQ